MAEAPNSQPGIQPLPIEPNPRFGPWRLAAFVVVAVAILALVATPSGRTAWQQIGHFLHLKGNAESASANVLSEHDIEALDRMSSQAQAELLLERSIRHSRGANDQIAARAGRWRGDIELNGRLNNLFMTALNSDDLRVRAAAVEVDMAAWDLEKSSASIDRLEPEARSGEQGSRVNALWQIALLGNRGVEPHRAAEILLSSLHDSNENVRYWALEGLSYLGTDEVIDPLLGALRHDPSANIRERAACGLAQSGMLSEKQRRSAVPKMLEIAEDSSLDSDTHKWVFQALRDITGKDLPQDAAAWRDWYNQGEKDWKPVTRDQQ